MKLKTAGLVHPKVPIQAICTLAVAALAYFGVDLEPEVSAAIGVVAGFVAGYFAPAAAVVAVPDTEAEAGQSGIQTLMIIALVLFIIAVVVWLV